MLQKEQQKNEGNKNHNMKIAIVTGASSGIGREFVHQIDHLYKELDEIWVIARREQCLKELEMKMKTPLRIFAGDLLESSFYDEIKDVLRETHPDLRMLVNAAGFGKSGTVEAILKEEPDSQIDMIDLNSIALSRMTFLCLPYCSKGTRIIQMASAAGFCPQPGFGVYAATKSYVLSFSRSLSQELKTKGICVTAVCPGPVNTEFFEVSGPITSVFKKMTMADAHDVVKQALKDSLRKKQLSIYGLPMKVSYLGSRLLPHRLLMKFL